MSFYTQCSVTAYQVHAGLLACRADEHAGLMSMQLQLLLLQQVTCLPVQILDKRSLHARQCHQFVTGGTRTVEVYCLLSSCNLLGQCGPIKEGCESVPSHHALQRVQKAGDRGSLARASGDYVIVVAHNPDAGITRVKLPSGAKKVCDSASLTMKPERSPTHQNPCLHAHRL